MWAIIQCFTQIKTFNHTLSPVTVYLIWRHLEFGEDHVNTPCFCKHRSKSEGEGQTQNPCLSLKQKTILNLLNYLVLSSVRFVCSYYAVIYHCCCWQMVSQTSQKTKHKDSHICTQWFSFAKINKEYEIIKKTTI